MQCHRLGAIVGDDYRMPFPAQEHFQNVPVRLLVVRNKHLDP
jgi:hypothetical protein